MTRTLLFKASAAALVALGTVVTVSSAALADEVSDRGLWYYHALGIDIAHADGYTGSGMTVAVIDGPVNLEVPTLQGANIDVRPSFCVDAEGVRYPGATTELISSTAHGTNITSLMVGSGAGYPGKDGVKGIVPDAHVLTYSIGGAYYGANEPACFESDGSPLYSGDIIGRSIIDAVDNGASVISISLSSQATDELEQAIVYALRNDVILVAALNNLSTAGSAELDYDRVPGVSNGVVSVLSIGSDGALTSNAEGRVNTSAAVDVVSAGTGILYQAPGLENWSDQWTTDGTSFAAPLVAGALLLTLQKYPEATPNQVLQSMIHNTGVEGPHDVSWNDGLGYGTVVVSKLLDDDPTRYEDVNPFISDWRQITGPSDEAIFGEPVPTGEPTEASTPTDTDAPPAVAGSNSLMPLIIGAGALVLLVIVVIIVIAVRSSRKVDAVAGGS